MLDLGTGLSVPDLALESGGRHFVAGADGNLEIPEDLLHELRPSPWCGWRRAELCELRAPEFRLVLWVYQPMRIDGRIEADSPVDHIDLRKVNLVAVWGPPHDPMGSNPEALQATELLRHRPLMSGIPQKPVSEEGAFRVELPRVRGYVLRAYAEGWQPGEAVLTDAETQFVLVRIEKPSLVIRGCLRDSEGRPLAGRSVTVYVTVRMRADEYDVQKVRAPGHPYSSRVSKSENYAIVNYLLDTITGADGSFEVRSNVGRGDLRVFVAPDEGGAPVLEDLGPLDGDRQDLGIVQAPGEAGRVRVSRGGMSLRGKHLVFLDLFRHDTHPCFMVLLDEQSSFPRAALQRGHPYNVCVRDEPLLHWYFLWDGRSELALDKLSRQPDWSK